MKNKQGELTKEFRILPNQDRLKELVSLRAEEIADDIKEEILEKIENGLGRAKVVRIASLFKTKQCVEKVILSLNKWADTFGYEINVKDDYMSSVYFYIYPKPKPKLENDIDRIVICSISIVYLILAFGAIITKVFF